LELDKRAKNNYYKINKYGSNKQKKIIINLKKIREERVHHYLVHHTNNTFGLIAKWPPNFAFHPRENKILFSLKQPLLVALESISWRRQTKGQSTTDPYYKIHFHNIEMLRLRNTQ